MPDVLPLDDLIAAFERLHGGRPRWTAEERITETSNGATVWDGTVQVFEIEDSPSAATRCYAWSHSIDGSPNREVKVVLGLAPVGSARDAVRAAIIAEHRERA